MRRPPGDDSLADDSGRGAAAPPQRRREIFRTVRGARLSGHRGGPAPVRVIVEAPPALPAPEPTEVYARRNYAEPND